MPHPLPPPPLLSLSFIPLFSPRSILFLYTLLPPHSSIPSPCSIPFPSFIPSPSSIPCHVLPFRIQLSQVSCRLFLASNRHSGDQGRPILDTLRLLQGNFGLMALLNLAEPFLELPCSPRLFLLKFASLLLFLRGVRLALGLRLSLPTLVFFLNKSLAGLSCLGFCYLVDPDNTFGFLVCKTISLLYSHLDGRAGMCP